MSPQKAKIRKTVRGVDITLRYTQDDSVESVINQRQFFDQYGVVLSPVTPKLLERQVQPSTPSISRLAGIDPRSVTVCFASGANLSGESNFQLIIPYAPGDPTHDQHLREIFNYVSLSPNLNPPMALDVSYHGENKNA